MRLFVLVPFYNAPEALQQCLRSLQHQSVEFKAILVDDGSQPAAHRLARHAAETDARFELLERPQNQGPAAARKTGLDYIDKHADDADVVVLVDGDDYLIRDRALEIIAAQFRCPQVNICLGNTVSYYDDIRPPHYPRWVFALGIVRHYAYWHAPHPRSFRMELYRRCRGDFVFQYPDGRWLQGATDLALIVPMLAKCVPEQVAQLDIPLYYYRSDRQDGGTIASSKRGQYEQWKARQYVHRSPVYGIWYALRFPRRTARNMIELARRLISSDDRYDQD